MASGIGFRRPDTWSEWAVLLIVIMMMVWLLRCGYLCWKNTRAVDGLPSTAEMIRAAEDAEFESASDGDDDGEEDFGYNFAGSSARGGQPRAAGESAPAPPAPLSPSGGAATTMQLVPRDAFDLERKQSFTV